MSKMNKTINLYEARKNGTFQVASIPNVGLLQSIGLRTGSKVAVQHRFGLGGPVLLRVEDSFAVAIGKDVAKQISVREVVAP